MSKNAVQMPGLEAQCDEHVQKAMKRFQVPGMSVAIVQSGQTLLVKGYGVTKQYTPPATDSKSSQPNLTHNTTTTTTTTTTTNNNNNNNNVKDHVDKHTMFCICSLTKLFTSMALGLLVEDNKLKWNTRVQDVLPELEFAESFITQQLTIQDLLTHRTGLGVGAGDLMWFPGTRFTSMEIVKRIKQLPQPSPMGFRSTFNYSNVLYLAAGEVVAKVSGMTWYSYVQTRILHPLGMLKTRLSWKEIEATGSSERNSNLARPHANIEGELKCLRGYRGDNCDAAGGMFSSADDMCLWMAMLTKQGELPSRLHHEGKAGAADAGLLSTMSNPLSTISHAQSSSSETSERRLCEASTWKELCSMQTVTRNTFWQPAKELAELATDYSGYGYGLHVVQYRGSRLLTHSGGMPGYTCRLRLLPEHSLAILVLSNQEVLEAVDAVSNALMDAFVCPTRPLDWVERFGVVVDRATAKVLADLALEHSRVRAQDAPPALSLSEYAGLYADGWYGPVDLTVTVTAAPAGPAQELRITFLQHNPHLTGSVTHWAQETFLVRWDDRDLRADALLTFCLPAVTDTAVSPSAAQSNAEPTSTATAAPATGASKSSNYATPIEENGPAPTVQQIIGLSGHTRRSSPIASATMKALRPDTDFSFDFHNLMLFPAHPASNA
eukprot:g68683.t1